ncbi:flagellar hook-basal body complex protein FliE [Ponticaulis sp.]|uniref:flagellar hook-basal body complex protein FliE n=1 Tax=Ponticaulis sp. TaxID=2020902 RepID=UPI000B6D98E0|nr:flagellar hook-basal body complex protein FliE [Ponticaulis sp.]MAJ07473.1 flagellar hook-basal body complex protein FliE [Ponticaulis sp.]RPG17705.1 MAG: flagellar hook-basal body complex protein FliE [Hyphomonadaceae bacterium TMED125]HBH91044.1 flagellar hook-basal body complex protein FliE [Hyphomonadaceae bacterium]HBJ93901.1 flagellar hook-basal body complex protein FliE [Hyphomonadaceae bacterium]|tara:strand:- start:20236 stop:20559 length:324 start_codon:yes stop_codon:yes gene_type:complete
MSSIEAVVGSGAAEAPVLSNQHIQQPVIEASVNGDSFQDIMTTSLNAVEQRLYAADELTRQYVSDPESVSIHEVILSLEKAKLSVDLTIQIRDRLVEGFQQITNMQL